MFKFIVLGSVLLLAACSRQPSGGTEPSGNPWVVTEDGVAAARIGTPRNELVTQGGAVLPGGSSECEFVRPAGAPQGLAAMVVDGTVRRVDVIEPGIPTAAGVGVGSSAADLNRAYPWASTSMPHKYISGGHYVVVDILDSPGGPRRLVFETAEDGTVIRYRAGAPPQVDWVEGCS